MNSLYKKTILLAISTLMVISCGSDDSDNSGRELMPPNSLTPGKATDLFGADGSSINISELQRRNPNFNLENLNNTGTSNVDLLTSRKFRSVTLEIVSIAGSEPASSSINGLVNFMNQRLNKPDGIRVLQRSIPSPGFDSYSTRQVFEDIEVSSRTQFNTDTDISIFIFFADADNDQSSFVGDMGSVTLGTAYFNTSLVIYQSSLRKIVSNNSDRLADVEASTLRHEITHLLGLVNIGTAMQTPHEDFQRDEDGEIINDTDGNPIGNGHCNVPGCLMEANARLISDMMGGIEPLRLDPLCIQDLQAIGGK